MPSRSAPAGRDVQAHLFILYAVPFLQVASHPKPDPRIHQYAKVSQLCELTVTQKLAWALSSGTPDSVQFMTCRTGWA